MSKCAANKKKDLSIMSASESEVDHKGRMMRTHSVAHADEKEKGPNGSAMDVPLP